MAPAAPARTLPVSAAIAGRPDALTFQRPELDTLRFFAFLMVFLFHAFDNYPAWHGGTFDRIRDIGSRGVDLFFALSAYLITELLLRERRVLGSISLRSFYARRVLRIWPLYYSFLLFAFFVVPHFRWQEHFPWTARLLYLAFLGSWRGLLRDSVNSVAMILWSVSVEEQFYLSWPFLVRASRRYHAPVCIGLLMFAVAYRTAHQGTHIVGSAADFATFARLDGIAAGALLAVVLDGRIPMLSARGGWMLLLAGAFAMAGHMISGRASIFANTVVAGGCIMILVAVLSLGFRNRFLEKLGRISYGLYVFHCSRSVPWCPIIQAAGWHGSHGPFSLFSRQLR